MTASYSKGRSRRYGYYFCQTRDCNERRKNIRRKDIEGDFTDLLQQLTPTKTALRLVRSMLEQVWEEKSQSIDAHATACRSECDKIDRRISKMVDKLIESNSDIIAKRLETEITPGNLASNCPNVNRCFGTRPGPAVRRSTPNPFRIKRLELKKLALEEKQAKTRHTYSSQGATLDRTYRTALNFLSNPPKLKSETMGFRPSRRPSHTTQTGI